MPHRSGLTPVDVTIAEQHCADVGRHGRRHRRLHVARARPRRGHRPAQRPVLARRRDVRDGDRRPDVQGPDDGGHLRPDPEPRPGAAQSRSTRTSSRRSSTSSAGCSRRIASGATSRRATSRPTCSGCGATSRPSASSRPTRRRRRPPATWAPFENARSASTVAVNLPTFGVEAEPAPVPAAWAHRLEPAAAGEQAGPGPTARARPRTCRADP